MMWIMWGGRGIGGLELEVKRDEVEVEVGRGREEEGEEVGNGARLGGRWSGWEWADGFKKRVGEACP